MVQILLAKLHRLRRQPADEVGPDPPPGILAQLVVGQDDVDPGLEGRVYVLGPVGR